MAPCLIAVGSEHQLSFRLHVDFLKMRVSQAAGQPRPGVDRNRAKTKQRGFTKLRGGREARDGSESADVRSRGGHKTKGGDQAGDDNGASGGGKA
jgi:hypothetical protein